MAKNQPLDKIYLNVDGKNVGIPVDAEVKAYFNEQFVRPKPTPAQKKRYTTLRNIIRAAYKKGVADTKANA